MYGARYWNGGLWKYLTEGTDGYYWSLSRSGAAKFETYGAALIAGSQYVTDTEVFVFRI